MEQMGYFTHADCRKHDMGADHPECAARLDAIEDQLLTSGVGQWVTRLDAPKASQAQVVRAHSPAHWTAMELANSAAQETQRVALDPDTTMNPHSWSAALHAAGAAVAAVDAVLDGTSHHAFCAVRPPGHHATREQAMGFCLINNAAVGVLHALERGAQRVAIVDFDVHHGNGTEDIVAGDDRVLMLGFFQHPFYPEGGVRSDAPNLLNIPVPAYTRGDTIRELVEAHWWPRLQAFDPDLIVVSAGFDAHREDDLGQLGLVEADYAWITHALVHQTRAGQAGRIVSCLEGGYNLSALARSVIAHIKELAGLAA
jgi:acetoin utilization deacetylase AcuC-like enzyme